MSLPTFVPFSGGSRRLFVFVTLVISLMTWIVLRQQLYMFLDISLSMDDLLFTRSEDVVPISPEDTPQVAWLLSFPNSGTSYTLALIEQASNRSIASNYGLEFSNHDFAPEPVHKHYEEGPYWEGLESDFRFGSRVRYLPDQYVLTKTHCGTRCVKCNAHEYLMNASQFLNACERTTYRKGKAKYEGRLNSHRVVRAVHLIRNPFNNVVSRFHLAARHYNRKLEKHKQEDENSVIQTRQQQQEEEEKETMSMNATGFRTYCERTRSTVNLHQEASHIWNAPRPWRHLSKYRPNNRTQFRMLLKSIPCFSEFIKYVEWHNHVVHTVVPALGPSKSHRTAPTLTLYYEDYGYDLPATTQVLLDFLNLPLRDQELRIFRPSDYTNDHFTLPERKAVMALSRALASPETWKRIRHYFRDG